MISATHVGCSTARNKGTCSNRLAIKRADLEERVLGALKSKLMDPALFREFCDEFAREMNRLRMEGGASLKAAKMELGRIDKQIKSTVDAIADGMYHPSMKAKMDGFERRKAQLETELAHAAEPPPLLHPKMADFYREQVTGLAAALRGDDGGSRTEAAERLRSLVSKIVLTPADGKLTIDVHGDLAGILTIAQAKALSSEISEGPDTKDQRRLRQNNKGRPREGAAFVADLTKQVKLVAGAGFEPTTFRL